MRRFYCNWKRREFLIKLRRSNALIRLIRIDNNSYMNVQQIPLRCYGEKPASFFRVNRSGGLPVATIKDITISESNDIMDLLEKKFPEYNPLWPAESSSKSSRIPQLLALERKVFSVWFQWLTSGASLSSATASSMDFYLQTVDQELSVDDSGPYFLGETFSLVDVMFTPFLERMAASLPYYKGFESRSDKYPHLKLWYEAMDQRPVYQGIKSDYVSRTMLILLQYIAVTRVDS